MFIWWSLCLTLASLCEAWDSDELALYDLVEELNSQNFYEFLGVEQDAKVGDIRRAYRKQSMLVHPDRNKDEDAPLRFRQLASIFEILKDDSLRETYNNVLEYGLPDWRMPVYYFRQVRRMPWWETGVIVIGLVTLCQYLMMWGAYFERKLTLSESFESMRKKEKKMKKKHKIDDIDDYIDSEIDKQLPKPQWNSLLPIALPKWIVHRLTELPALIKELTASPPVEKPVDDVKIRRPAVSTAWMQPKNMQQAEVTVVSNTNVTEQTIDSNDTAFKSQWTMDELTQLIKLTTHKFPTGTLNRWEKVAQALNRKPEDITAMVAQLKKVDPKDYGKLCTGEIKAEEDWSADQQKCFEQAIQKYPKTTQQRWENISQCMGNKTKEECMQRYKHLVDLVRQRKVAKP